MRFILIFLLTISYLFANIATVVDVVGKSTLVRDGKSIKVVQKLQLKKHDFIKTGKKAKVKIFFKDGTAVSLGKNTSFKIDSYLFNGKKNSNIKFKVIKGFIKTVTGKIGKIAPNKFKLQTKTATIGIRGTVFAVEVGRKADVVICTDGVIVLFTKRGIVKMPSGNISRVRKGVKPKLRRYSQSEKDKLIKNAGWHGSMSLKELIVYVKKSFKEPLRSQLLATMKNILDKDSDERKKFTPKIKSKIENADDIGFVDNITINGREFDSLQQREIEFYTEDLQNGKVVIQGLLESEDKKISVKDLYVEITVDGVTWTRAKGHSNWEYSFKPKLGHNYKFSLRVVKQSPIKKYIAPKISGISASALTMQQYTSTFTPKVITTRPIIFKFKKFIPKVITTDSIVFKFKKFIPKVTTTRPIVLKLKRFTPKVVTTNPIVFKFEKFIPKVITTRPIVLKLN